MLTSNKIQQGLVWTGVWHKHACSTGCHLITCRTHTPATPVVTLPGASVLRVLFISPTSSRHNWLVWPPISPPHGLGMCLQQGRTVVSTWSQTHWPTCATESTSPEPPASWREARGGGLEKVGSGCDVAKGVGRVGALAGSPRWVTPQRRGPPLVLPARWWLPPLMRVRPWSPRNHSGTAVAAAVDPAVVAVARWVVAELESWVPGLFAGELDFLDFVVAVASSGDCYSYGEHYTHCLPYSMFPGRE